MVNRIIETYPNEAEAIAMLENGKVGVRIGPKLSIWGNKNSQHFKFETSRDYKKLIISMSGKIFSFSDAIEYGKILEAMLLENKSHLECSDFINEEKVRKEEIAKYPTEKEAFTLLGNPKKSVKIYKNLYLQQVTKGGAINYVWLAKNNNIVFQISIGGYKVSYSDAIEYGKRLQKLYNKGLKLDYLKKQVEIWKAQNANEAANSADEAALYTNAYIKAVTWLVVNSHNDWVFDDSNPPGEAILVMDSFEIPYDVLKEDLINSGATASDH